MYLIAELHPGEVDPVRERRDHQRAHQRADHAAAAAEEARAADHGRRDRVEQDRPAAGVQVDGVQPRGEDHAAEAGHRPGDHEDDQPDVPHVDARATGRLGVPADGVDVTAEGRALRDPRPEHEQDDHEQERDREAALLVRPVDDPERDRREADDLQRDEHEVVGEDPVSPATDHPRQRRDQEQAGRDRRDERSRRCPRRSSSRRC